VFVDADPGVVVRADVGEKTVNDLAEPNGEPEDSSFASSGDQLTDDNQLTIDEFGAHTLEARNFCVLLDGKQLFVGTTAVKTKNIKDGVVR